MLILMKCCLHSIRFGNVTQFSCASKPLRPLPRALGACCLPTPKTVSSLSSLNLPSLRILMYSYPYNCFFVVISQPSIASSIFENDSSFRNLILLPLLTVRCSVAPLLLPFVNSLLRRTILPSPRCFVISSLFLFPVLPKCVTLNLPRKKTSFFFNLHQYRFRRRSLSLFQKRSCIFSPLPLPDRTGNNKWMF